MRTICLAVLCVAASGCYSGDGVPEKPAKASERGTGQAFLDDVLNVEPYLPGNLDELDLSCEIPAQPVRDTRQVRDRHHRACLPAENRA